jgi:hypothetical protein
LLATGLGTVRACSPYAVDLIFLSSRGRVYQKSKRLQVAMKKSGHEDVPTSRLICQPVRPPHSSTVGAWGVVTRFRLQIGALGRRCPSFGTPQGGLEPVELGHADVHQDDVRDQLARERKGLAAVFGFAHDLDVFLGPRG